MLPRDAENQSPISRADVLVIGGGHAGVEAAWAAANAGCSVVLLTLDPDKIGVMSCNPAIGGLAKGQMVREIDALGGLMARATDATSILSTTLNLSKGPAVRAPRAQCDKHAYAEEVRRLIAGHPSIVVVAGAAERFVVDGDTVRGVVVSSPGRDDFELRARAVVLTTGTFMRGLMHTGDETREGGRDEEAPSIGVSAALRDLGFELGRLKTGTPPRVRRGSLDWDALERQTGDETPRPFSDLTDAARFPIARQAECRITRTTEEGHDAIRANLHRAPMFSGKIESQGPRYCPSIEDKVVRFAQRASHQVFLEPESHRDDSIYCNGIATSLPRDVQDLVVRSMPGCARAEILRYGYAVEYDMVPPHQIDATTMTKRVAGLFLAGQINGTSGYEEAAGQGIIAGINAARFATGRPLVTLGREQAFIGVLLDDLVTKTPREPYRMFTSRAEHRLLLRADNAADRLTPLGREWGVVGDEQWSAYRRRAADIEAIARAASSIRIGDLPLARAARRQDFGIEEFRRVIPGAESYSPAALETVLTDLKYDGYLVRQRAEVRRRAESEHRRIPAHVRYDAITGLRNEARQALTKFRPATIGQAGRLEGVTPADLTLLMIVAARRPANG